jgi:nucleotide-binding universal stress UspA family protein
MVVLKNILVAMDFGEAANAAFTYGRQLARSFSSTLHLVHVTDDFNARAISVAGFPEYLGSLNRRSDPTTAETRLSSLLSEEERAALGAKAVVLTSAAPAQAIVDYAKRAHIDLIAGTFARRGAPVHGQRRRTPVRSAPCAVLTVPAAVRAARRSSRCARRRITEATMIAQLSTTTGRTRPAIRGRRTSTSGSPGRSGRRPRSAPIASRSRSAARSPS